MSGWWQRALRISHREWLDFLQAKVALAAALVTVRVRSKGQLLAYDAGDSLAHLSPERLERAAALATAVDRAARFGIIRPQCLVRSLALQQLLRRAGIPGSRIRIGVRPEQQGLLAHAWVTLADRVLGDDPRHTGRFVEIADARLAGLS